MSFGFLRSRKNKDANRYYLFPGMGGKARQRKEMMMLRWSVGAGIVISGALALAFYYLNQR